MMSTTAGSMFTTAVGATSVTAEASISDPRGNITSSDLLDGSRVHYIPTDGDLVSARVTPSGTITNLFDGYGNLTNDGTRVYTWDAEMRLTGITPSTPTAGACKLTYTYDPHSRRDTRDRYDYDYDGGTGHWRQVEHTDFMYAGWLLLAERIQTIDSGTTNTSYRVYTWGPDFKNTMQAASPIPSDAIGSMGGIGGLISVTHQPAAGAAATYYYCNDLSGNIVAITDETGTNIVARYDYTAKGALAATSDPDFTINPFTWRGKYHEPENGGLLYFGYRHYSPALARWTSRDPIGKAGGINENAYYDPDPLGLAPLDEIEYIARNPLNMFRWMGWKLERQGRAIAQDPVVQRTAGAVVGAAMAPTKMDPAVLSETDPSDELM
jgi:RHS repeat-associated protein